MSPAGVPSRLEVRVARKRLVNASGLAVEVLADLSLCLPAGRLGALIGPSGAGKSTLLRIVAGLDADFEGAVVRPPGPVSMAFQEPRLLPWRSVEDNIRLAAPALDGKALDALLASLGLAEHRGHFPGELSLGLARRVALARAYAAPASLLLLDEPFASLDRPLARTMQAQLAALVEARGLTTLLVTHDVGEAVRLAHHIWVLSPRPAKVVAEIAGAPERSGASEAAALAVRSQVEAALGGATG